MFAAAIRCFGGCAGYLLQLYIMYFSAFHAFYFSTCYVMLAMFVAWEVVDLQSGFVWLSLFLLEFKVRCR